MEGTGAIVTVDAQLLWIVRVPQLQAGLARAASREQLTAFCGEFDALEATLNSTGTAAGEPGAWVGAIALAVLESLHEPPELPFIGEPFGGEGGTD
jgi:hypothetical protein